MKASFISIIAVLAIVLAAAQSGAAPATQPSQTPVKVYVAPFSESGSLVRPGWLSSRFTEAVRDDLDQIQQVAIVKPAPLVLTSTTTIGEILSHGKQAGAEIAVVGIVHASGDQLSVSGDVYDVSSGSSFGNFKASGTTQDLFAIQDSITHQIHNMVLLLAPAAPPASTLANAGSKYQGSELQQSVNSYNFRGLHLSNSASTNYKQQPYHLVEQPNINFLVPYYEGGYGYSYGGWPGYPGYYSLPSPYYSSPFFSGWGYWPTSTQSVIILNQNNGAHSGKHHHHGAAMNQPVRQPSPQVPPEIATRNENTSHVATPPPNTIQRSPSYQIRYGPNTIQKSPSYQIQPVQR